MSRLALKRLLVALLLLAFGGALSLPASAQLRGPTSFLDRLFGIERPAPPEQIPLPDNDVGVRLPPPVQPRKKRPAPVAEPVVPAVVVAPKNPDAKKVLVIGDFIASGLAWGLDQSFAGEPGVQLVDRSDGPSGFVRDDYVDWVAKAPELLTTEKPDLIVIEVGANDRQVIRTKTAKLAPRSDAWQDAYQQRIARFLLTLQSYGKPVYWVGAPPMRSPDAAADMVFLNSIYKAKAEAIGASFVDVWDGFADDNGKFVARGPDVDGQMKSLRASDGINFTKAGLRKLAFYVEQDIGQHGGLGLPAIAATPVNPNSTVETGPDGKERRVGPVVSLTDPAPGSATAPLAGAVDKPVPMAAASLQERLTVEGQSPAPPVGRVDDYSWKPAVDDQGPDGK